MRFAFLLLAGIIVLPNTGLAREFSTYSQPIIAGSEGTKDTWPFVVAVVSDQQNENGARYVQLCTGSVIAPDLILTAAHCVFTKDNSGFRPSGTDEIKIIAGASNIDFLTRSSIDRVTSNGEDLSVSRITIHPSYNTPDPAGPFDLAVVQLARDTSIQPATLAPPGSCALNDLRNGSIVTALGFGSNQTSSRTAGAGIFREGSLRVIDPNFRTGTEFQAVGVAGGNTCAGDSGGPIVADSPEGPILIGVVSRELPRSGTGDLPEDISCGPASSGLYGKTDIVWDFIEVNTGFSLLEETCQRTVTTGCSNGRNGETNSMWLLLVGLVLLSRRYGTSLYPCP